jgi:adenylate cyclase
MPQTRTQTPVELLRQDMGMRRWYARLTTACWVLICLAAYVLCSELEALRVLEKGAEDLALELGTKPPCDPKIVILEIDSASLRNDQLAPPPWRPAQYAAILRRLDDLGARIVAFDVLLEHVYENADLEFADAVAESRASVVLASQWSERLVGGSVEERCTLPAREFRQAAGDEKVRAGTINLAVDGRCIREAWLLRQHPVFEDRIVPSMPVVLAELRGDLGRQYRWPPDGPIVEISEQRDNGLYCRIFYAGPPGTFRSVTVEEVMGLLPRPTLRAEIDGATVLIGATAPEYHDLHETPVGLLGPTGSSAMAGIEIHANILNQLRLGVAPRSCSHTAAVAWTVAVSLLLLVPLLAVRPVWSFFALPLALILVWIAGLLAFEQWLVFLPVWAPSLTISVSWVGGVVIRWITVDRQKIRMRRLFNRCLHESVISDLMQHDKPPALAGEKRTVTVFFCDIRGFTSLSDRVKPEEIVARLREYFEAMCEVIYAHKGAVDKFIGDAIMAFFGTPHEDADHARHAIACALAMRERLEELNREWMARRPAAYADTQPLPPLSIGFGISTGDVVAGMLGSKRKMEYTVIGDTVNVASRLESMNKELGTTILVTDKTRQAAGDEFVVEDMGSLPVRGKTDAVGVFSVTGRKPANEPNDEGK